MRNYIAVVFNSANKAYDGLSALWFIDSFGEITVHGTAVVHRDPRGQISVDSEETHPALATAAGVGIGALLGLLAGPVGLAAGAAGGAAIGAAAGSIIGIRSDVHRASARTEAITEAAFVLGAGKSAVIAEVSENSIEWVDNRMRELGGQVYRLATSDVTTPR